VTHTPRPPLVATARRLAVAGLGAALVLPPLAPPARAQEQAAQTPQAQQAPQPREAKDHRFPRRYLLSMVGALVGIAASSAYLFTADDRTQGGTCTDRKCVVPITVGAGALVGYMVGREMDQLHSLRYRGGAPLKPPTVSAATAITPTVLAVRDSLVAVGGAGGVQVFSSGDALRLLGKRATGVRGIAALDVAPDGSLALGATTGFYLYPPRKGPGSLVREGSTSGIAAARGRLYVGAGTRVESVPPGADTTRSWPGIDLGAPVADVAVDETRHLVWVLADSTLFALRPAGDSLERVGAVQAGGPGRQVAFQENRVAVALGEGGVRLFDATNPAEPRETGRWTGARFAYDVSFAWRRLYVASGVEGVYVLDVSGSQPVTEGLARELGFVIALASSDGYTYVLDRTTNAVRRIPSDF
jgi:hypothetical protein